MCTRYVLMDINETGRNKYFFPVSTPIENGMSEAGLSGEENNSFGTR